MTGGAQYSFCGAAKDLERGVTPKNNKTLGLFFNFHLLFVAFYL
jgi:hypothetical protein